jgi:small subunit ribosomal protein S17
MSESKARNIGVEVPVPDKACNDKNCPFHGTLSVRGQIIEGVVASDKMQSTVIVEREYLWYLKKYERYEKRTRRYAAHAPPCLNVKAGDHVQIMECRPLSKTVSFVVINVKKGGEQNEGTTR